MVGHQRRQLGLFVEYALNMNFAGFSGEANHQVVGQFHAVGRKRPGLCLVGFAVLAGIEEGGNLSLIHI